MFGGSSMLFLGVAGSNNDINVLNQSPLFTNVLYGQAPAVNFMVNGHEYNRGYYLADGIYPSWPVFTKGIFLFYKVRNISYSQMLKQHGAKMSSALLEC
jgi:hypothetical protein